MKTALALTAALALGGCATIPVPSQSALYQADSAFTAALLVAANYRETSLCAVGMRFTIAMPCHERAVVAKLIVYADRAKAALTSAENLVTANPGGIGVIDAIAAARDAVSGFTALTKKVGG